MRTRRPLAARLADRLGEARDRLGDLERLLRFSAARRAVRPRDDDVFVASYPRSGTTWVSYMLHLLVGRDDDFEHIDDAVPWFERGLALGRHAPDQLARRPTPRCFKTHLLPRWLPRRGRFIYLQRDGLEVARSYYGLYRDYLGFDAGFAAFFERFVQGEVQYGSWAAHVRAWEDAAPGRPILILRYHELERDPVASLREMARFLGWSRSEARLERVVELSARERMRRMQTRFDHATAILREHGVVPGRFINPRDAANGPADLTHEQRRRFASMTAQRHQPRAPLSAFLR